jgi:hypothetical protein
MPRIIDRVSSPETEQTNGPVYAPAQAAVPAPAHTATIAHSPEGNPAPNRGIFPPEFMYDFQTARFYPDSPYFVRGNVDVITPVRNLALQAYVKAGGTIA